MSEVIVAGKKVVLHDGLPIGQWHAFVAATRHMWPIGGPNDHRIDFATQVEPILPIIDSWEFAGDPHDLAAVGALDAYDEFLPLWQAITDHVLARINTAAERQKNVGKPPTSV